MNNSNNLNLLANSSAGLTMGTGIFQFLNDNASAIGSIIAIIMAFITIYFHIKNSRLKEKEYELKLIEHIAKMENEKKDND